MPVQRVREGPAAVVLRTDLAGQVYGKPASLTRPAAFSKLDELVGQEQPRAGIPSCPRLPIVDYPQMAFARHNPAIRRFGA